MQFSNVCDLGLLVFPFALATVMLVALTPRVMAEGQMVGAETVPPPRGKMGIGRVANTPQP